MQVEGYVRVLLAERVDDFRQHVAGLGVRGTDVQRAVLLVINLVRQRPDVLYFLQHAPCPVHHLAALGGQ